MVSARDCVSDLEPASRAKSTVTGDLRQHDLAFEHKKRVTCINYGRKQDSNHTDWT